MVVVVGALSQLTVAVGAHRASEHGGGGPKDLRGGEPAGGGGGQPGEHVDDGIHSGLYFYDDVC